MSQNQIFYLVDSFTPQCYTSKVMKGFTFDAVLELGLCISSLYHWSHLETNKLLYVSVFRSAKIS